MISVKDNRKSTCAGAGTIEKENARQAQKIKLRGAPGRGESGNGGKSHQELAKPSINFRNIFFYWDKIQRKHCIILVIST